VPRFVLGRNNSNYEKTYYPYSTAGDCCHDPDLLHHGGNAGTNYHDNDDPYGIGPKGTWDNG